MREQAERVRKPVTPAERLDFLPYPPVATSRPLGWPNLRVEHFQGKPDLELRIPPLTHHLLLVYQRPPDRFAMHCDDLHRQAPPSPGSLLIVPAGVPTWWEWRGPCDSSQVQLDPRRLAQCAAETFDLDPQRVALPTSFELSHPPLQTVIGALHAELRSGGIGGPLLAESLGIVLAVHLLRRFVAPARAGLPADGVLPKHKLRAVVEYIHGRLDEELSLDRLAAVAYMSPYHFARLFRNSTGLPPHQYVIARRVERAKELLRERNRLPLAEVAAEVGFTDQSHFTRHFKRLVGVTPRLFR
jgi:AraC family transcriptional regulator